MYKESKEEENKYGRKNKERREKERRKEVGQEIGWKENKRRSKGREENTVIIQGMKKRRKIGITG
jgi:hypothetical protein